MLDDLKLIDKKLREARKLPENNPAEYNYKQDILIHWKLEKYMLKSSIKLDTRACSFLTATDK